MRNSPEKLQKLLELLDELLRRCCRVEQELRESGNITDPDWRWNYAEGVEEFRRRLEANPDDIEGGYPYGFTKHASEFNAPNDVYDLACEISDFLENDWQ